MTYSDEEIRRQLQLGEDSHWEFKAIQFTGNRPRSPRRDDLADEIAAFANAIGGVLLCGVTDDGEVEGMSREQIVVLDSFLVETSTDSIAPAVRIRTTHRQLDGRLLLVVDVPEGDAQHEPPRDGLNKSVDCSSTHRKLSRADGLFRVSLGEATFASAARSEG